jgi:glycerophosphoryl diester phosphodiesterase
MSMSVLFLSAALLGIAPVSQVQGPQDQLQRVRPSAFLGRAHSHNDYRRTRPLFDALERGFASIEIDVFLVDGRLLVGHDRKELTPERTIETLYLEPLAKRIRDNEGTVYPKEPRTFWVLLDFKADGEHAYEAFKATLTKHPELAWKPDRRHVRFVASGDRPIKAIERDKGMYTAIDGRWGDLSQDWSVDLMPWISESWLSHFKWLGSGEFPASERTKLNAMVKTVHDSGRRLRFWGAADSKPVWELHRDSGVDWINTDRPTEFWRWWQDTK